MSSLPILCFVLTSLALFTTSAPAASNTTSLTVYEAMQEFNFPVGLLPKGITDYELNRGTGEFKVYLNKSCEFYVQGYKLKYKSTISGVISRNELKDLEGISVKVLFVWLNIGEVSRDGDTVYFSVGIISASFGVENFVESPQCGCGFDCNSVSLDRRDGEWYLNRFLSSY